MTARELTACLRTGRALPCFEGAPPWSRQGVCGPRHPDQRAAAEAEDRAVPMGRRPDHRTWIRNRHIGRTHHPIRCCSTCPAGRTDSQNPALAGHGAEAVRDALTSTIAALPDRFVGHDWDQARRWPRPKHRHWPVFFCDPRSWQRGTNENTNGLLRQYPKVTTSAGTALATSLLSRPHSTADRGKLSVGERHPSLQRTATLTPLRTCCDVKPAWQPSQIYKLLRCASRPEELYELTADPHEEHNLSAIADPAIVGTLREKIARIAAF